MAVLVKDSPHLMLLAHLMGLTILQGLCMGSCPPAASCTYPSAQGFHLLSLPSFIVLLSAPNQCPETATMLPKSHTAVFQDYMFLT